MVRTPLTRLSAQGVCHIWNPCNQSTYTPRFAHFVRTADPPLRSICARDRICRWECAPGLSLLSGKPDNTCSQWDLLRIPGRGEQKGLGPLTEGGELQTVSRDAVTAVERCSHTTIPLRSSMANLRPLPAEYGGFPRENYLDRRSRNRTWLQPRIDTDAHGFGGEERQIGCGEPRHWRALVRPERIRTTIPHFLVS
jgi:hypothetical protein